jgi:NADH dehydrogenase
MHNCHTLILGGGFAGLFAALHLGHRRYPETITLVDRQEHFVFKPLLYELLSGEMSEHQVQPRFDELLKGSRTAFINDSVRTVNLAERRVELDSGLSYRYCHLVIALGAAANMGGAPGAAEHAFFFRTGEDVLVLKRHLRHSLQLATQERDPQERRRLLTAAVIGAGPAGVELAATLADWLPTEYHGLGGNPRDIRVVIFQRGTEILQGDMTHLRETATAALRRRAAPVEVVLEAAVTAVHPERVEFTRAGQSQALPVSATIWTGGNATHPLVANLAGIAPEHRDRHGRLVVEATLQLPGYPEVFAAGDCAVAPGKLPATAQVAFQQGATIAHNLLVLATGSAPVPARPLLLGTLMKLGLTEAAAELFDRYEIRGRAAHLARQFRYLQLLPTPVHNFHALTEWLTDTAFLRFMPPAPRLEEATLLSGPEIGGELSP